MSVQIHQLNIIRKKASKRACERYEDVSEEEKTKI